MAQDEHPREEEQEDFVPDLDRPQSFDRMTAREQREGDTVNTRHAREEPDDLARARVERPASLVDPAEGRLDDLGELVASEVTDPEGVRPEDLSPEERAMSYRDEDDEL